MLVDTARMK